jgi:IclR family transcriptional regulator, acetate operon repressor
MSEQSPGWRQNVSEHLVKSAARSFEILEHFNRERRPLRLRDFVDHLDYPTSSIAALLKSMVAQGYMIFDPHARTYLPTARLAQLVNWVPVKTFEQGVVLDIMYRLQRTTRELIVLGVEDDIYLEYVHTLRSTEGMQLYIAPGTRRLLVQTGTGWLFLSRRPREQALEIYRRTIIRGELTEPEFPMSQFEACLDDHRDRDISFSKARDLVRPVAHWGGGMVSALLPVPDAQRPLAIGVGGPADRLEQHLDEISQALRDEIATLQQF